MFSCKDVFNKCEQICKYLQICSHLLKKSLKKRSLFMQFPCQQNFFVFRIKSEKKSQFQKVIFLRDFFHFHFDTYLCSFLTHFYARWYQNVIHTCGGFLGSENWGLQKRLKFCKLFLFCELYHEKTLFFHGGKKWRLFPYFDNEIIFYYDELFECTFNFKFCWNIFYSQTLTQIKHQKSNI